MHGKICTGMAKMLDRATAMGDEICNSDDHMWQSVLVKQEQTAIWREEQQLFSTTQHIFNTTEETISRGESMEESDNNGETGWRYSSTTEEENSEDCSFNNHSNLAWRNT